MQPPTWGIDVPSCLLNAHNPTFGPVTMLFFRKSITRSSYVMNFSLISLHAADMWRIWKQHHHIEWFWKVLKSVLHIRDMRLQGDGLYAALLIKVLAYLLASHFQAHRDFSKCSITQIMRDIRRCHDLRDLLEEHFHGQYLETSALQGR
jgi:hypothetical protein